MNFENKLLKYIINSIYFNNLNGPSQNGKYYMRKQNARRCHYEMARVARCLSAMSSWLAALKPVAPR